jgi:hypothetical protein
MPVAGRGPLPERVSDIRNFLHEWVYACEACPTDAMIFAKWFAKTNSVYLELRFWVAVQLLGGCSAKSSFSISSSTHVHLCIEFEQPAEANW